MNPWLVAPGWDGTNPLYMLAALGLLRLVDQSFPGAKLGWYRDGGAFRPRITTIAAATDEDLNALAQHLRSLGHVASADPAAAERVVRDAKSKLKKLLAALKTAGATAKVAVKERGLTGQESRQFVNEQLRVLQVEVDAQQAILNEASSAQGESLGHGIAHVGDIIGVPRDVFRRAAERAQAHYVAQLPGAQLVVGQTAALACDQVVSGETVTFSPLSFANGASEQKLLRATRQCMALVTPDRFRASLSGDPAARAEGKGLKLGWDPGDNRLYALMWADPAATPEPVDVVASALAYLGMGVLTAFPWRGGLSAVGWGTSPRGWSWPLWDVPIPLSVVRSLLGDSDLQLGQHGRERLAKRGIVEVRICELLNPTGKRNFFAPSRPV